MEKLGRNESCHCGSGKKYKYCCIGKDASGRSIKLEKKCACGNALIAKYPDDMLSVMANLMIPIKNFCKDNGIYLFGIISVGKMIELQEKLSNNVLTLKDIMDAFISALPKKIAIDLLDAASGEMATYKNRYNILRDGFEAHYEGKYTLSVPSLYPQLEGIMRDIGGLQPKEDVRPVIPLDVWDRRLLFSTEDDARNFNGFITKIFQGSQAVDAWNRNTVLHGLNISYYSEEHSILIILSILELRLFNWFETHTKELISRSCRSPILKIRRLLARVVVPERLTAGRRPGVAPGRFSAYPAHSAAPEYPESRQKEASAS